MPTMLAQFRLALTKFALLNKHFQVENNLIFISLWHK
jgi:hypothetical protein